MKSTSTTYGTVAVSIHWLSAILIIALLISGFRAATLDAETLKVSVLAIHAPMGIAVLLLTLFRILWWGLVDRKPAKHGNSPIWQVRTAILVHVLLYIVTLGMVASGIGMMALSGAGKVIFGGSSSSLPDFWDFKPRVPHGIGARVLLLLLALHVGAALYHQFIKKDGSFRRIWFN
ncbi:cytochrome b/b6 domain-containing protein [Roseibium sp. SCPC15]|uniref:cytochrome b n=1 Tax=Roseibium sp. SCP15 TaxID=3141376 RepID=UPI00333B27F9